MLPCVLFEDEHLLVVNKPAGVNTHAPSPWAGEGIYDWLRNRERRWASLAIIHRLDKETSGLLVFGLSPQANRSLTAQFAGRRIEKRYLLLTDRNVPIPQKHTSCIQRAGERYVSRPVHAGGEIAETLFRPMSSPAGALPENTKLIEAVPLTGRTHQIRVHAADSGFPILGDTLYGGTSGPRVYLHAAGLQFDHPASGAPLAFEAPFLFQSDPRIELRRLLIDPVENNALRLLHGASDRLPGLYVERLADWALIQSEQTPTPGQVDLARHLHGGSSPGVYHRQLTRQARGRGVEASPRLLSGAASPQTFSVLENGLRFELSLNEGYSVGLFLDQRDNRRRLLTGHVGAGFDLPSPNHPGKKSSLLNAFAYTCGFSVAAGKGGFLTTSLDLSRKYLDWGKRNFELNGLNPAEHDFIHGDVFDWLKRLGKKGRAFDAVILDPPTFSQSRESGVFRAERDYPELMKSALNVLSDPGVVLASTNAAGWAPEHFVKSIRGAVQEAGWVIQRELYVPQPMDFPVSRAEPAYLKTLWLRVARR